MDCESEINEKKTLEKIVNRFGLFINNNFTFLESYNKTLFPSISL